MRALRHRDSRPNSIGAETVTDFERDLADVINRHSRENASNTPDHILAQYLAQCLSAFEAGSNAREGWYGTRLAIKQPEVTAP